MPKGTLTQHVFNTASKPYLQWCFGYKFLKTLTIVLVSNAHIVVLFVERSVAYRQMSYTGSCFTLSL